MALGGGTFLVQNKVLPGAYINFISVAQASATLSDRGIVTIPLAMNWGPEGKIFTVEQADFIKNSQILTRNVTDFEVDMTVNHSTEDKGGGSGAAAYEAHKHAYVGKKTFKVHNALKAGEKVLLIRVQQGKKFVVIDRVKGA